MSGTDEQSPIATTLAQIGPRLKRIRTKRGLSLSALAEATGISKSTLSRLECGTHGFSTFAVRSTPIMAISQPGYKPPLALRRARLSWSSSAFHRRLTCAAVGSSAIVIARRCQADQGPLVGISSPQCGQRLVEDGVAGVRTLTDDSDTGPVSASVLELVGLLVGTEDVEEALRHVAEVTAKVVPGRPAVGVTLQRDHELTTVVSTSQDAGAFEEIEYERQEGPCVDCLRERRRVVVIDTSAESRWGDLPEHMLAAGVRSVSCFPLDPDGVILGALNLYFTEIGGLKEQDEPTVTLLADHAALLLVAVVRQAKRIRMTTQLEEALASRSVIDQAIGIIMGRQRIPASAAFAILRRASQQQNRKLRDIAAGVVESTGGAPAEPGTFRRE